MPLRCGNLPAHPTASPVLRALCLLFLLGAGCSTSGDTASPTSDRAVWAEARARWDATTPDRYSYRVDLSCECSGVTAYYVSVVGARVDVSAALDFDGNPLVPGTEYEGMVVPEGPHGPSIDELFELLDDAIRAGNEIQAAYDPTYGYPTSAQPDVVAAAVDGSTGYRVSAFEVR